MKSILEELFYGNVCPNTDCRSKDKETKELMGYVADHHDTLLKELSDKQKETLEKFDDCYNELTDINERDIFVYAFRLGARIAIEVLLPTTDSSNICQIIRMTIFCALLLFGILQIERRMIMANIENKESTNNPINKTSETLIKELETMSDAGLHDLFIFF